MDNRKNSAKSLLEERINAALQEAQQRVAVGVLAKKDFEQVATAKRARLEELLKENKSV